MLRVARDVRVYFGKEGYRGFQPLSLTVPLCFVRAFLISLQVYNIEMKSTLILRCTGQEKNLSSNYVKFNLVPPFGNLYDLIQVHKKRTQYILMRSSLWQLLKSICIHFQHVFMQIKWTCESNIQSFLPSKPSLNIITR